MSEPLINDRLILSTKNNAAPFVALLVNTRGSTCRIIRLQSGLNSQLLTAQRIVSVVKSQRVKVESAVCHVCQINFVRTTRRFIGNLLSNSKASAPLNEILTGNFKLPLNCASNKYYLPMFVVSRCHRKDSPKYKCSVRNRS